MDRAGPRQVAPPRMALPYAMPTNRTEAQQRADDIRTFRAELERLDHEGVLRLQAAERLALSTHHDALLTALAREFDIDRDTQASQLSMGMRIASFLGALALAASVFFLFYQFWGRLPTTLQVAILVGASLAALGATWLVHMRDSNGYFTKLAAMVAFACFVLNIAMLGQVFDITPSDKALLPWAAFAFLLAYAFELRLLQVAGILCITAFIAARAGTWHGMYWLDFGERPENFLPAGLLLVALPHWIDHRRFPGFAATYRVFGLITIFLAMLVMAHWGAASYLQWPKSVVEGGYQVLGFLACAAAIAHGARRQHTDMVNTGVVFFVIFLYTKFFDWWWDTMPKWLFFLVLALSAILLLFIFRRLRRAS
jgi:uncharacterized membrane protein